MYKTYKPCSSDLLLLLCSVRNVTVKNEIKKREQLVKRWRGARQYPPGGPDGSLNPGSTTCSSVRRLRPKFSSSAVCSDPASISRRLFRRERPLCAPRPARGRRGRLTPQSGRRSSPFQQFRGPPPFLAVFARSGAPRSSAFLSSFASFSRSGRKCAFLSRNRAGGEHKRGICPFWVPVFCTLRAVAMCPA